jgi:hypothetical protein
MFYTHDDTQVNLPDGSVTPGLKAWDMVELPSNGFCFVLTVKSSYKKKEDRILLFSELNDVLAFILVAGRQRITGISLISQLGKITSPPVFHFGSIEEIWTTDDMPVGMAYLMKDGKEWSGGALPKQDEANKLKLMFRLDNELVSEGR